MPIENICITSNNQISDTTSAIIFVSVYLDHNWSQLVLIAKTVPPSVSRIVKTKSFFDFKSLVVESKSIHRFLGPNPQANINNSWKFYSFYRSQRMVFLNCCSQQSYIPTSTRKYMFHAYSVTAYCFCLFSHSNKYPIRGLYISILLLTHRGVLSGSFHLTVRLVRSIRLYGE